MWAGGGGGGGAHVCRNTGIGLKRGWGGGGGMNTAKSN